MTGKSFLIGALMLLSALITACGTAAIPEYEQGETAIAVARTETREASIAQGEIVPTNTPSITPSPTVDFEATTAAEQAEADAQATLDAEAAQAEADAQATADAEAAAAQAEADAQATLDAEEAAAAQPGGDLIANDPLADAIANADIANGEMLFVSNPVQPCTACHFTTDVQLVGPGQLNLLQRTIERIENGTIEAEGPYSYIYESIINPGDYIAEGFVNVMPDTYEGVLSEQDLYDLVAYLASLTD